MGIETSRGGSFVNCGGDSDGSDGSSGPQWLRLAGGSSSLILDFWTLSTQHDAPLFLPAMGYRRLSPCITDCVDVMVSTCSR